MGYNSLWYNCHALRGITRSLNKIQSLKKHSIYGNARLLPIFCLANMAIRQHGLFIPTILRHHDVVSAVLKELYSVL